MLASVILLTAYFVHQQGIAFVTDPLVRKLGGIPQSEYERKVAGAKNSGQKISKTEFEKFLPTDNNYRFQLREAAVFQSCKTLLEERLPIVFDSLAPVHMLSETSISFSNETTRRIVFEYSTLSHDRFRLRGFVSCHKSKPRRGETVTVMIITGTYPQANWDVSDVWDDISDETQTMFKTINLPEE